MRRSVGLITLLAGLAWGCLGQSRDGPVFVDQTRQAGLDFVHYNGMSGAFYLPEIMGGGVALFDYDRDGDLDIYLVQGAMLGPGKTWEQADRPPPGGSRLTDRLYRNDTPTGGPPAFTDVTRQAGLSAEDYGMGVAAADFDRDGWVDLYVSNYGSNRLLRNNRRGGFEDMAVQAGVADASWSVSTAFVDLDRDGWLDLYVGNYVQQRLAEHKPCRSLSSALDYCTPVVHRAQADRLYRNLGNGRFQDISLVAGIAAVAEPALGVMPLDANLDGWPDIYVANDAKPNLLWLNDGKGGLRDDALFSGVAVNMEGVAEGSMGVAAGDFDNDGDADLFMTHLTGETNTLYVNNGKAWFEDRSAGAGLGGPSMASTGFGTGWVDFDNDGDLDVYVANGDISVLRATSPDASDYPLEQPDQLFENRQGRFVDISSQSGETFAQAHIGRGLAIGDIDNDGDSDLLVSNNSGRPQLLINRIGNRQAWLGLDIRLKHDAPALGATLQARFADGGSLWRGVQTAGSYASAGDPRVLLGLGGRPPLRDLLVTWPDGRRERFEPVAPGQYQILKQGSGVALEH